MTAKELDFIDVGFSNLDLAEFVDGKEVSINFKINWDDAEFVILDPRSGEYRPVAAIEWEDGERLKFK